MGALWSKIAAVFGGGDKAVLESDGNSATCDCTCCATVQEVAPTCVEPRVDSEASGDEEVEASEVLTYVTLEPRDSENESLSPFKTRLEI